MAEKVLLWSDRALNEYEGLLDYLWKEWGEEITLRIVSELDAMILSVQNDPDRFPIVLKNKLIRRCVFSSQTSIYFRLNNNIVEIVSLFDNR
jgi:plasmid stabilization system protein ParE